MTGPSGEGPGALLLDLSRLVSRVGRGPFTGIDRVEAAWLDALLDRPGGFALVRAAPGYVLLDREGAGALRARLTGEVPWGRPDLLSRLHLRQRPERRRAMADLRRLALGATPGGPRRLLARHLPARTVWIATGHANLTPQVFDAVHALPGGRAAVLIHDTIPLDHPEFSRPEASASFAARFALTGARADLVFYNSAATRAAAEARFAAAGRVPPGLVAPLGVTPPAEGPRPKGLDRPYCLVLGTVEPRKNHAFLLDLWERLAAGPGPTPLLVIAGARGWRNTAVFARLDARPAHVLEIPGPDDATVSALIRHAHAVLFPSLAEGFGLPAAEAAAAGVPVVCNDLPVLREVLGAYPRFAPVTDMDAWCLHILDLCDPTRPARRLTPPPLPGWDGHVASVLAALAR